MTKEEGQLLFGVALAFDIAAVAQGAIPHPAKAFERAEAFFAEAERRGINLSQPAEDVI